MEAPIGFDWTIMNRPPRTPDEYSSLYPDRPIRPLPKRLLQARDQGSTDFEIETSFLLPRLNEVEGRPKNPKFQYSAKPIFTSSKPVTLEGAFNRQSSMNFEFGKTPPSARRTSGVGDGVRVASLFSPLAFRPNTQVEPGFSKSPATFGAGPLLAGMFDSLNNQSIKKRKVPIFGLGSALGPLGAVGIGFESPDTSDGSDAELPPSSGSISRKPASGIRNRQAYISSSNSTNGMKLSGNAASRKLDPKSSRYPLSLSGIDSSFLRTSLLPSTSSSSSLSSNDLFPEALLPSRRSKRDPSFPVRTSGFNFSCPPRPGIASWPGPSSSPESTSARQQGRTYYSSQSPINAAAKDMSESIPPKAKRSHSRYLLSIERRRRAQQQRLNSQKALGKEDTWICEFCEYESIFGKRPEALIRQYESKALGRGQRVEDHPKPSVEKAKTRTRKNRRGGRKVKAALQASRAGATTVQGEAKEGIEGGGPDQQQQQSVDDDADVYIPPGDGDSQRDDEDNPDDDPCDVDETPPEPFPENSHGISGKVSLSQPLEHDTLPPEGADSSGSAGAGARTTSSAG